MKDEFSGIFDDLSPEDFDRSSVRYAVDKADRNNFRGWVDQRIEATRVAWLASDGALNPVAYMRTRDSKVLLFSPDDDESVKQYIDRLTREAKRHEASWFYTTILTRGGMYEGPSGQVDSPETIAAAEEAGAIKPCIYFYAERRGDPGLEDARRHGIIAIEGNDTGEVFDAPSEHASPIYVGVLG